MTSPKGAKDSLSPPWGSILPISKSQGPLGFPGLTPWAILVPPLWGFQFFLTTRAFAVKKLGKTRKRRSPAGRNV